MTTSLCICHLSYCVQPVTEIVCAILDGILYPKMRIKGLKQSSDRSTVCQEDLSNVSGTNSIVRLVNVSSNDLQEVRYRDVTQRHGSALIRWPGAALVVCSPMSCMFVSCAAHDEKDPSMIFGGLTNRDYLAGGTAPFELIQ
jgi:hypothetical protein